MLSTISWTQYITYLFMITASYYAVIATLFYRQRLSLLFRGQAAGAKTADPHLALQLELQLFFARAASQTRPREEFLQGLRSILRHYPTIKGTNIHVAMNAYIQSTCAEQFGLTLQEAELRSVWD